jgi:putative transposase
MRYRRLKVEGACYFFTLVTEDRRNLFVDPETIALLEKAIAVVGQRHPFEVEAQVIMPDHLHALWQLPEKHADYSTRWRLIKEALSKVYVKQQRRMVVSPARQARGEQALWQRRFWEHLVRDDRDFGAHLDYIHLNPVHHGLVTAPRDWPHSTFKMWVARGRYIPEWGSDAKPELPAWAKRLE